MVNERKDIKYQIQQGYKLQTIMHTVNKETLIEQHRKQQKNKASGVDNITKEEYEQNLDGNINNLLTKMKSFSYKPQPVRRAYIPKGNGKLRPLGIPAYEDKLVQGAMADVLNEIYENIFLNCSYGFRPNRNCHDVIRYINDTIMSKKVNYIIEADIKGFFDNVDHEWLMKFLKEVIQDTNFLRYIKRFLISGYMENMTSYESDKGTPQGGLISPILANVYLHYALDLWIEKIVKPRCNGEVYYVRYADDFILMFQYKEEAQRFKEALGKRLEKFNLELEQNKTRILPFGRFNGTKDHFDFLGFTFYNGTTAKGKYRPVIKTAKKKLSEKKQNAKKWLHANMHNPIPIVGENLKKKLLGHYMYYGINGNIEALAGFHGYIHYMWYKTLRKRGQKRKIKYCDYERIWEWLGIPKPKIKLKFAQNLGLSDLFLNN